MNAERRKKLTQIQHQLSSLYTDLENVRDEEEEAVENMIEGDKKDEAQEKFDILVNAVDDVQNAIDSITDTVAE